MKKRFFIVWSALIFVFLVIYGAGAFAADSDVDLLLDLLVQKGVLTDDDAAGFRADLAIKRQDEAAVQSNFNVLAGRQIKVSGYTQARYQATQASGTPDGTDIRRARLDIKGDTTARYDYRAQIEFGGTKGPFLLDATVGYKLTPALKLLAGQFKIPFSQENLTSSPKLETINRSQVVEALAARGKDAIGNQNGRDIGAQLSGSFLAREEGYAIDYVVGLFNGSGINAADKNEQKDLAGRLVYHAGKGLDLGASYYNGYGNWGTPARSQNRDRAGVEFTKVHAPLSFKGEYVIGTDGGTRKDGWYVQAGYFFSPKKVQGVLKYDIYDADTRKSANETAVYTFGLNRYFNKWAALQLNYELKREQGKELDNDALTAQFTLSF